MTDPFDDLEGQLRRRVREGTATAPRRRGRWMLRRTPLVALAVAGLSASGVAVAASGLGHGPSAAKQAHRIALQADFDTRHQAACMPPRFRDTANPRMVSAGTLFPEIHDRVAALQRPATAAELAGAAQIRRRLSGLGDRDAVIAGTVRLARGTGDLRVLVYVTVGSDLLGVRDPQACAALRRDRAIARAADRGPSVRRLALRELSLSFDTRPDLQMLHLTEVSTDPRSHTGAGAGIPVLPGSSRNATVPYGLMLSGGNAYVGLASPRAARILIRARTKPKGRGLPSSIAVDRGVWAVRLRRGTGRLQLTEVAADGTTLRVFHIR